MDKWILENIIEKTYLEKDLEKDIDTKYLEGWKDGIDYLGQRVVKLYENSKTMFVVLANEMNGKSRVIMVTPYYLYADIAKRIITRRKEFKGATIVKTRVNTANENWEVERI